MRGRHLPASGVATVRRAVRIDGARRGRPEAAGPAGTGDPARESRPTGRPGEIGVLAGDGPLIPVVGAVPEPVGDPARGGPGAARRPVAGGDVLVAQIGAGIAGGMARVGMITSSGPTVIKPAESGASSGDHAADPLATRGTRRTRAHAGLGGGWPASESAVKGGSPISNRGYHAGRARLRGARARRSGRTGRSSPTTSIPRPPCRSDEPADLGLHVRDRRASGGSGDRTGAARNLWRHPLRVGVFPGQVT